MKKLPVLVLALAALSPLSAFAVTTEELEKQIADLSQKIEKTEKKADRASKPDPITFSGDFQFRADSLSADVAEHYRFPDVLGSMLGGPAPQLQPGEEVKNDVLFTNRLGLNMNVRATEKIALKTRFLMYKVWGHETAGPVSGANGLFADRYNVFDGNAAHLPEDSILRVDQAYATYSGVLGQPLWFSVGRRPSTGGVPTNLRRNVDKSGAAGTPGILVDYAFDGMVLGYAPEVEGLPGSYAKLCYGKGFDSGLSPADNSLKDVDMLGVDIAAFSTDALHVELQWNRAFNIFAFPEYAENNTNLGDIDQLGTVVTGKVANLGPGSLNWFVAAAMSMTHPNDNLYAVDTNGDGVADMGVAGLLYDAPALGGSKESLEGTSYYVGARYDIAATATKIGAEFNHGSKNWVTFAPAAEDMITSKLGTRGNVYEVYLIQELKGGNPISRKGKAYLRLGYQYYAFDYTGSNNWVGAPKDIDELSSPANAQMFSPVENAHDVYLTFNVEF